MAENTIVIEGIAVTVGLATDDKNRIYADDFLPEPPPSKLWIRIKNVSDKQIQLLLPRKAVACFIIMDQENKRLWSHPGHVAPKQMEFKLDPDEVYEEIMDAPWNEVFIKPESEYILAGWLNGFPHLRASITFSLTIKES